MMRTTIRATGETDAEATAADLRVRCERARVPSHDTEMIVQQTERKRFARSWGGSPDMVRQPTECMRSGKSPVTDTRSGSYSTRAGAEPSFGNWQNSSEAALAQRGRYLPHSGYGYPNRYSRSAGHERALEHIREAQQLTRELGGSDQDVKKYFFSIPQNDLREILDEYEVRFGTKARDYAEETLPKWRDGQVQMSGLGGGTTLPPAAAPHAD